MTSERVVMRIKTKGQREHPILDSMRSSLCIAQASAITWEAPPLLPPSQVLSNRLEKLSYTPSPVRINYLGVVHSRGLRVARNVMKAVTMEKTDHVTKKRHQCSLVVK